MPTQLAADTTLLEPAEGCFRWIDGRVVDRYIPGFESMRDRVGAFDVAGPEGRRETIFRAVGHSRRVRPRR